MPTERTQSFRVICEGGLNSNDNHLELGERYPGMATSLINFEPSPFGGYRRFSGYEALEAFEPEVDPTNGDGAILGIWKYGTDVLCARGQAVGSVYKFYKWVDGAAWDDYVTGLTLTSTQVRKIRAINFNYTGTEGMVFVDGINNATYFDGTNWNDIDPANTGADATNAGGPMALTAPSLIAHFQNHVFVAGDTTSPHVLAHSAPRAPYDWTAASGAGQIVAGFAIVGIKAFRDELYVFGDVDIKKVVVDGSTFVLKDVAKNVGCIAPDSIQEINGDLIFLSQDGFRTVAGTEKIGDVELAVLSKSIQQDVFDLIPTIDLLDLDSVIIRQKSQIRFFFSNALASRENNLGIVAGIRSTPNGASWEWGRMRGIQTSCAASFYIGSQEYVLHGTYDGKVYRQEMGNSFDGEPIPALYTHPYYDMGDVYLRKTPHAIKLFLRPEGSVNISLRLTYDWDDSSVENPNTYIAEVEESGEVYGEGIYGVAVYGNQPIPVTLKNIEGSGYAMQMSFFTNDTDDPYTIQGFVYEFAVDGRK